MRSAAAAGDHGRARARARRGAALQVAARRPAEAALIFQAGPYRAVELEAKDIPRLQRFFEENPEYFHGVEGRAPKADQAEEEFHALPPAGWPFSRKWILAFEDARGEMAGMAGLFTDLHAPSVWHIGLFIVATRLHGSGAAQAMHAALEAWARVSGARWLRLGVVEGNVRGERFWEKSGYVEVRRHNDFPAGERRCTLRMMVKMPRDADVAEYLERVPRDRPESP